MHKDDKYLAESKKRLAETIKRKIMTAAIGAISNFEEQFGNLWGLDKNGKLNGEELEFKNKWEHIRGRILDLANSQIKNMNKELESYEVDWNSITLDIKIKRN